ncbi:hypothetical protein [Hoyosella altamirensis]|uniref:Uncharacterized protein n=1 Tax=Hoyosella altamirensis TaxID=616997 RepID=A0A839RTQ9_9ACTN|nr:hypothetical protein [Hoyosella altamirensis]MBB3039950.1 hypothetical protein [Hoyosella altamirensis]
MGRADALKHVVAERKDAVLRRSLEVVSGPEGYLVSGRESEVEGFTSRVIGESLGAASAVAVPARLLPAVTGSRPLARRTAVFVKVAPDAREVLAARGVLPSGSGIFRTAIKGANAIRSAHLHWVASMLSPKSVLSAQLIYSLMSLRTAVRDTESAVERVGSAADSVLALAQASRAGDVIGHHRSLCRLLDTVDESGVLASADWEAMAPLGPMLEVTVERLRAHASRTLDSVPGDAPVSTRARHLGAAAVENRLGETLQLLAVAEESVYVWQQLRTERVRADEPQHLEPILKSVQQQLQEHRDRDSDVVRAIREQLAGAGAIRMRDVPRWGAAAKLRKAVSGLRDDLDHFAQAREGQLAGWLEDDAPDRPAALGEVRRRAAGAGRVARSTLGSVGSQVSAISHIRGRSARPTT